MKRLLFVSNLFPLPWEPGRGLFNAQQAHALAQTQEVLVWVPVPWHVWFRQPRALRQRQQLADNLQMVSFPFFYPPGLARASYALLMFLSMLVAMLWIRDFRPQRMLASWLYPDAVAASWLARLWRIPVVMKAHGSDVNSQCQHAPRRVQVRRAARGARAVYTVSQALASALSDAGIDKPPAVTIYNGIDQARFVPRPQEQARQALSLPVPGRMLLFVGNLKTSKGILDAVRALAAAQLPADTRLYMIGDGADRSRLQTEIERLALSGRVQLMGAQPHDTVPLWMAAADVLLLPSHAEGVPNVVLESMAAGRPVVASRVGGIAEVLPAHAGILVEAHDTGQLASAMQAALNRHWDSQAIREHAQQFTWDANAAAINALWPNTGTNEDTDD